MQKPTGISITHHSTITVLPSQQRHYPTIHLLSSLPSPFPSPPSNHKPIQAFVVPRLLAPPPRVVSFLRRPPTKATMVSTISFSLRRTTNRAPEFTSRRNTTSADDLSEVFMMRSATLATAVLPAGYGNYECARDCPAREGAPGKLRRLFGFAQRPAPRLSEAGGRWTTLDL